MQIKRIVEKEYGKSVVTYFEAEIAGEIVRNHHIFRELLGITREELSGLLSRGELRLTIGDDWKTFKWTEDLYTIERIKLRETLQKRINEVKEWIATLTYLRTDEFTIEV